MEAEAEQCIEYKQAVVRGSLTEGLRNDNYTSRLHSSGALCRRLLRILIPARPAQVFRTPLHDLIVLRVCATTIS